MQEVRRYSHAVSAVCFSPHPCCFGNEIMINLLKTDRGAIGPLRGRVSDSNRPCFCLLSAVLTTMCTTSIKSRDPCIEVRSSVPAGGAQSLVRWQTYPEGRSICSAPQPPFRHASCSRLRTRPAPSSACLCRYHHGPFHASSSRKAVSTSRRGV